MSQGPLGYSSSPYLPPDLSAGANTAMPVDQVTTDAPCRKCGYNLRGALIQSRCPECGTPVAVSVMGSLLRFSDPAWVRTLYRGVVLILFGIFAIVAGVIGVTVIAFAAPQAVELTPLLMLVGTVLMLVGAWRLTEPDPSGIGEDIYGTARRIIRIALVVGVFDTLLDLVTAYSTLPPGAIMLLQVLATLAGIVGLVGQVAQLNYLGKLASRIPDDKLARRARFFMWGIGTMYGTILLIGLMVLVFPLLGVPRGRNLMAIGVPMSMVGLAMIVFGFMYLSLLDKLRLRFRAEAHAAELHWHSAVQPTTLPAE